MVDDSPYDRYLLEPSRYAILIFARYIGFRSEGMQWAKYRVPIRERKPDKSEGLTLDPLYKSTRLVTFRYDGMRYIFYKAMAVEVGGSKRTDHALTLKYTHLLSF